MSQLARFDGPFDPFPPGLISRISLRLLSAAFAVRGGGIGESSVTSSMSDGFSTVCQPCCASVLYIVIAQLHALEYEEALRVHIRDGFVGPQVAIIIIYYSALLHTKRFIVNEADQ